MMRLLSARRWSSRPRRPALHARRRTRRCAAPPAGRPPSSVRPLSLRTSTAYTPPLAVSHLRLACGTAVYDYWLDKRKRLGKPALRRLQPPPAVTDPNPFNVFRPREKLHRHGRHLGLCFFLLFTDCRLLRGTHRPQTRRRRENDGPAFQRMRSLRHNLDTSRAILEWLQRRERRKRDIIQCEIDLQLLNMKLRHDAPQAPAPEKAREAERPVAEQPAAAAPVAAVDAARRAEVGAAAPAPMARPMVPPPPFDAAAQKQSKKRRRDGRDRRIVPGADQPYVPPPTTPEIQLLFAEPPSLVRIPGILCAFRTCVSLFVCAPAAGAGLAHAGCAARHALPRALWTRRPPGAGPRAPDHSGAVHDVGPHPCGLPPRGAAAAWRPGGTCAAADGH